MPYHHAQSNACRSDATRSNLAPRPFGLAIGGTDRTSLIDQSLSFTVKKEANGGPSSATFTVNPGASVTIGQSVELTVGADCLLWGGVVVDVTDVIVGSLVRQQVEAVDWGWLMDTGPLVSVELESLSVNTAVARVLALTVAADGFGLGYIDQSLPDVSLAITDARPTEAIEAIAQACGAAVWRIRPRKRVDVFTSGYPWARTFTLVNATDGMSLSRRKEGGQIRTRTYAVGRDARVVGDVAAGASTLTVDTPWLFRPSSSGSALVENADGAMVVDYTGVSTAGVMAGVSGITRPLLDGDSISPYEGAEDTAAQTALAALLGRSGVAENRIQVDGGWEACAAAAAADVAQHKSPITTLAWVEQSALATHYEAGAPVTVTLTAPVTESGTFVVQSVELAPGSTLVGENPRWLASIEARVTRRPQLIDVFRTR